jgi:hypothetical protein
LSSDSAKNSELNLTAVRDSDNAIFLYLSSSLGDFNAHSAIFAWREISGDVGLFLVCVNKKPFRFDPKGLLPIFT